MCEQVLTWILKESLGGNAKTGMLATISPSAENYDETLSTLRYAHQARSIVNTAKVNEDPNVALLRELRDEIERLRMQYGDAKSGQAMAEISSLRDKLSSSERLMQAMNQSWEEKLRMSEAIRAENQKLRKEAQAAKDLARDPQKIDNRLPNLVNLNEDPQLSDLLVYIVKEGITSIGNDAENDIELKGNLVQPQHCCIECSAAHRVNLTALENAIVYVNGEMMEEDETRHLNHGDRVIIGNNHYFRINVPSEVSKRRNSLQLEDMDLSIKDHRYAKEELERVQKERLRAQLEDEHRKEKEDILLRLQQEKEDAQARLDDQKRDYELKLKNIEQEKSRSDQEGQSAKQKLDEAVLEAQQAERDKALSEVERQREMISQERDRMEVRMQEEKALARRQMEEETAAKNKVISALEQEKAKIEQDLVGLKAQHEQRRAARPNLQALTGQLKGYDPFGARHCYFSRDPFVIEGIARCVLVYFSKIGKMVRKVKSLTLISQMWLSRGLPDNATKQELLHVMVLVKEANELSKRLNQNTIFRREDNVSEDGEPLIRLHNTKLDITTVWTLDKLERVLIQVSERLNNSREDFPEDMFYDPNDDWQEDQFVDLPTTPSRRRRSFANDSPEGYRLNEVHRDVQNQARARRKGRMLEYAPDSPDTPGPRRLSSMSGEPSVAFLCREYIRNSAASLSASKGKAKTIADELVESLSALRKAAETLYVELSATPSPGGPVYQEVDFIEKGGIRNACLSATLSMDLLCATIKMLERSSGAAAVSEIIDSLHDGAASASENCANLLTGLEKRLRPMVKTHYEGICEDIKVLSMAAGELAIATHAEADDEDEIMDADDNDLEEFMEDEADALISSSSRMIALNSGTVHHTLYHRSPLPKWRQKPGLLAGMRGSPLGAHAPALLLFVCVCVCSVWLCHVSRGMLLIVSISASFSCPPTYPPQLYSLPPLAYVHH